LHRPACSRTVEILAKLLQMNKSSTAIVLLISSTWTLGWCSDLTPNSIITTYAGANHTFSGDGGSALSAGLSGFQQLSTDRNGNIIFADTGNHVVSRLNRDGSITVLAGNGIAGFSGEGGQARSASLRFPSDAAMDKDGNLFIYDSLNFRIRRVTPDGVISTYAGTGIAGYTGDNGPATQAHIQQGGKMAIDAAGNVYFTDGIDFVVRRITLDGTISTFAGNGNPVHAGDGGPAANASIGTATGALAIDSMGNLYIAEDLTNQIRKVTPNGIISTLAGSGTPGFRDGPAATARFLTPVGLAVDSAGDVFVADVNNGLIRKISPGATVSTVAGTPIFGFAGDGGPALQAQFRFAEGVAVGGDGDLYLVDTGNFRIRVVSADGTINTAVGTGAFQNTPDGTPAANATLSGPLLLSFDPSGSLLIADGGDYTVKRVNADGRIQTIAGFGVQGVGLGQGSVYALNFAGPATDTLLFTPRQAVADANGNIFISDQNVSVVYRITPDGNLNLYAGQVGVPTYGGDNIPATNSSLAAPQGLALDQGGNLYIADPADNRIRRVSTSGIITTFAGTGKAGFSGDGGPATQATLSFPQSIAFDPKGNLIIADRVNNRLRMVTPDGIISTVAGNGTRASTGNGGPAAAASLNRPFVVTVDASGNIFIIESGGTQVRQISTSGVISVIAGDGQTGFSGDGGPAIQATLGSADGLATDASGNLYVSDLNNNRVRVVLTGTPTASASPTQLSFFAPSGGVSADPQAIGVSSSLPGLQVVASSDSSWLKVTSAIAFAPGTISISADPTGLGPGVYQGTINLGSPGLTSMLAKIPVTFRVGLTINPKLSSDTSGMTFSLTAGGTPISQSLRVLNIGAGQVKFYVRFNGPASGGLASSIAEGTALPNQPTTIVITADPANLPPGTNSASLLILGTNLQFVTVPITVTVTPRAQKMALSRQGFTFVATPGGGVTQPQTFSVLNTGTTAFNWTAKASTVSGSGWLAVSPDSGSSSPASFGSVSVSVNPSGLIAGVYYGLILVSSSGTVNSPQQLEVVLNVVTPDQNAGATVSPSGLIFKAPAGGDSPSSQTFSITNLGAADVPLALQVTTPGGDWLAVAPDNGIVPAGTSQTITVQPVLGSLASGVYNGSIAVQTGGTLLSVNVLFVVVPPVPSGTGSFAARLSAASAACTPANLYPVFTSLSQGLAIPASWPLPIQAQVVDDCGNAMTQGRVMTSFSNGDPLLSLASLQDGRWEGIWFGRNIRAGQIVITANADQDMSGLHGSVAFTGMLVPNPNVPVVNSGGVTSGVPPSQQVLVAPGDLIAISGQYFAAAPSSATQLPLQTDLGGTEVLLAGANLPLIYSSSGQITAVVPYDLAPDSQYQVIVSRGGSISGPEPVTVATAQPSILKIDTTGSPAVAMNIWAALTAGTPFDATSAGPATPLQAGTQFIIYCTGLGPVDQSLDPAMPPPPTAVNTLNVVSVTIGTSNFASDFAGLVPGYPGVYQVMGTVPTGVSIGDNIPVTISTAGQTSMAIRVSVQ
jgi:uncharacterized protein (TIGR03437 family)